MSMKAFSSKLCGKGYSSKNATVQCIHVLYIYVNFFEQKPFTSVDSIQTPNFHTIFRMLLCKGCVYKYRCRNVCSGVK